jgi:hypothetical protein
VPIREDRPRSLGFLAAVGAFVFGVPGGVAGLVLGLLAYPPTAWFAVFEIGLPCAVLGTFVGLVLGAAGRPGGTNQSP